VPDAATMPEGALQAVVGEATYVMPVAGFIDLAKERARLAKEMARLDAEALKLERKLGDPNFRDRAPPEVVAEQEERRADAVRARDKLQQALARIT
jgi:valyl-tRNA synthetase